jgi:hypothetical protein
MRALLDKILSLLLEVEINQRELMLIGFYCQHFCCVDDVIRERVGIGGRAHIYSRESAGKNAAGIGCERTRYGQI